MPFLLHEDHLDVSPTRSTFSFGSFSGIGEDRRSLERGGWQTTILGAWEKNVDCKLFPHLLAYELVQHSGGKSLSCESAVSSLGVNLSPHQ